MNRWSRLGGVEKVLLVVGSILFVVGSLQTNTLLVIEGWFMIWLATWDVR